jgi:hypothetical protein
MKRRVKILKLLPDGKAIRSTVQLRCDPLPVKAERCAAVAPAFSTSGTPRASAAI